MTGVFNFGAIRARKVALPRTRASLVETVIVAIVRSLLKWSGKGLLLTPILSRIRGVQQHFFLPSDFSIISFTLPFFVDFLALVCIG